MQWLQNWEFQLNFDLVDRFSFLKAFDNLFRIPKWKFLRQKFLCLAIYGQIKGLINDHRWRNLVLMYFCKKTMKKCYLNLFEKIWRNIDFPGCCRTSFEPHAAKWTLRPIRIMKIEITIPRVFILVVLNDCFCCCNCNCLRNKPSSWTHRG